MRYKVHKLLYIFAVPNSMFWKVHSEKKFFKLPTASSQYASKPWPKTENIKRERKTK
jgi:hypothetical protein